MNAFILNRQMYIYIPSITVRCFQSVTTIASQSGSGLLLALLALNVQAEKTGEGGGGSGWGLQMEDEKKIPLGNVIPVYASHKYKVNFQIL